MIGFVWYFLAAGTSVTGVMSDFSIVPRAAWNARPPVKIETMPIPVPHVIIHHSYIPAACGTPEECIRAMQTMQDMHQLENQWNDIGYSFAVGGDSNVYEGRGWNRVGAHAPKYNNISIGICVIGDWSTDLPPPEQLEAVHKLIKQGVEQGAIQSDYKLLGHRQVRETECPGDRLFEEIRGWEHFIDVQKGELEASGGNSANFFFFKGKS